MVIDDVTKVMATIRLNDLRRERDFYTRRPMVIDRISPGSTKAHLEMLDREIDSLVRLLQPHDLDAPEVEPVDSAAPPATTGGVDDDAGNSERQARLEPIPLYPWQVDVLRSLRGRLSALEDRQRLPCRFPFAACDLSEGIVPRQVDAP